MLARQAIALFSGRFTVKRVVLISMRARSETIPSEAAHVLLVHLMLVFERSLNAPHKHISDLVKCCLDVIIELPARLLNGFLNQALHQSFHVCDIAMSNSSEELTHLCLRPGTGLERQQGHCVVVRRMHQQRETQIADLHLESAIDSETFLRKRNMMERAKFEP
jgi:hypothetical protein